MGTFSTYTSLAVLMPGVSFDTSTNNLAARCIDWAEGYIRGQLSRRYNVAQPPFTVYTTTSMLTCLSEQLAMGHLYKNLSRGSKESISRGDALISDAKEQIKRILDKESELLDASTGSVVVSERTTINEVICSTSSYHTTFDEDDPLNWAVDSDKLTQISDDRL